MRTETSWRRVSGRGLASEIIRCQDCPRQATWQLRQRGISKVSAFYYFCDEHGLGHCEKIVQERDRYKTALGKIARSNVLATPSTLVDVACVALSNPGGKA